MVKLYVTSFLERRVVYLIVLSGGMLYFLKAKGAIGDQWSEFQRGENKKYREIGFPVLIYKRVPKGDNAKCFKTTALLEARTVAECVDKE